MIVNNLKKRQLRYHLKLRLSDHLFSVNVTQLQRYSTVLHSSAINIFSMRVEPLQALDILCSTIHANFCDEHTNIYYLNWIKFDELATMLAYRAKCITGLRMNLHFQFKFGWCPFSFHPFGYINHVTVAYRRGFWLMDPNPKISDLMTREGKIETNLMAMGRQNR